jgi:ubiquinone/menaquinone biosynthesis C-methylase UbiE
MRTEENAKIRAATSYNAASDYYNRPAKSFWDRFGLRTIERLELSPGARVLDACCGSGASALPAAGVVGSEGSVLGVDLAHNLLRLAREEARRRGLRNVDFRTGDILELGLPDASFDAVVCVFGIFFIPDMELAVRELWRLVRPGGKLAITTWGPRFFEPASTAFWDSIRAVRPDLYKTFNPWDQLTDPESLSQLMTEAGVENVEVVAEAGVHKLETPEDWWAMVMGTGYRGTVEQLDTANRERVQRENLEFVHERDVRSVEANVVYAIGEKSQ